MWKLFLPVSRTLINSWLCFITSYRWFPRRSWVPSRHQQKKQCASLAQQREQILSEGNWGIGRLRLSPKAGFPFLAGPCHLPRGQPFWRSPPPLMVMMTMMIYSFLSFLDIFSPLYLNLFWSEEQSVLTPQLSVPGLFIDSQREEHRWNPCSSCNLRRINFDGNEIHGYKDNYLSEWLLKGSS